MAPEQRAGVSTRVGVAAGQRPHRVDAALPLLVEGAQHPLAPLLLVELQVAGVITLGDALTEATGNVADRGLPGGVGSEEGVARGVVFGAHEKAHHGGGLGLVDDDHLFTAAAAAAGADDRQALVGSDLGAALAAAVHLGAERRCQLGGFVAC